MFMKTSKLCVLLMIFTFNCNVFGDEFVVKNKIELIWDEVCDSQLELVIVENQTIQVSRAFAEKLMGYLESKKECPHIMMNISSHWPSGHQTKGNAARFFILGYLNKKFPPYLASDQMTKKDKVKIDNWVLEVERSKHK